MKATLDLTIHEIFGGFNNGALSRLNFLTRRSKRVDRTEYVGWNALQYATHWAQRISAAIVFGDARRALDHVAKLKRDLADAPLATMPNTSSRVQSVTFASPVARDVRKDSPTGPGRAGARGRR